MPHDADCFIRHIRACTNAELPGGRERLRIGAAEIGWIAPAHAPRPDPADRAAFDRFVEGLAARGLFARRHEAFDVRDEATGAVVATVDRGAIPLLGITAAGVHVNGLVRRGDGLHLWVGRRAPDKRLDPDKLDQITAGGIPAGHDAAATVEKEGAEEAGLPGALARSAAPVGTLRYAMEREGGLRRDCLFCFDLWLPQAFTPRPVDGEVVGFELWPIEAVLNRVATTDDFKFNVNLVLIDLFLRLGLLDDPAVEQAIAPLRRRLADR